MPRTWNILPLELKELNSLNVLRLCRTADTIEEVIKLLERDSTMLIKRLCDNQLQANTNKCHLLVNKKRVPVINLGETEIKNNEYEKLLGIKVDTKLNFNEHNE